MFINITICIINNKDEIKTIKTKILESYVLVDKSILLVPSESIKIIFEDKFGFPLGVSHNQIPLVHELSFDDISNPFPGYWDYSLFNNKFIK